MTVIAKIIHYTYICNYSFYSTYKMQTILITGSTDGVGLLTAHKLAKSGHQIIVHGRNTEKLQETIVQMKSQTGNENISGYISDFSDFKSIQIMLSNIKKDFNSIDVLINNAGVFISPKDKNQEGLDMRFAVNYLAPYILTNGLLTLLKNSKSPRLINLSSAAQSSVSIAALKGNETIMTSVAYAQSKLALTIWSFAFAKVHPNMTTIAVNPGSLLNTNMVKEAYGHYWSSPEKGADILVALATMEDYQKHNGTYFDNDKGIFAQAHPDAYQPEIANELITETQQILSRYE